MRERIPLEILKLEGSPNIRRSLKREAEEHNAPPLDSETKSEIEKLDELISMAMKACRRGHTFRGKPNPAFDHLSKLIKSRDILRKGRSTPGKSDDLQVVVSDFLKKAGVN